MISIVLPYYSGSKQREGILVKLKECFKNLDYPRNLYEIIAVEDGESLKDIADVHIKLNRTEIFNKSWHINCGIRKAKYDWILMLDCDMIFPVDYFKKIREAINIYGRKSKFFLGFTTIFREAGTTNACEYSIIAKEHDCAGGAFVVEKNHWWDIGGANENYQGHGGEDRDIYYRAKYLSEGNSLCVLDGVKLIHPYHDWAKATKERLYLLTKTFEYTEIIINRLRNADLGNKDKITMIDLSDIPADEQIVQRRFHGDACFNSGG